MKAKLQQITRFDFRDAAQTRNVIAAGIAVLSLVALWCWLESKSYADAEATFQSLERQVTAMRADAGIIQELQTAPRIAVERERPNDELLDQIRKALSTAEIPETHWIGNTPSAALRIPESPYKRLSTFLTFKGISLEQIGRLTHALVGTDSSLSIARLKVTAPPDSDSRGWQAELEISYLLYSPHKESI